MAPTRINAETQMVERVIIDCDPGIDDAIALLLAFASPGIEILGITAVASNIPLKLTEPNARRICEIGARTDLNVFAGCGRPLLYPSRGGPPGFHGADGLGGNNLPEPTMPLQAQHAVNFIIDRVRGAPGGITIAALGPMTNIAAALAMAPDIADKIKRLVFMGGAAFCPGNVTAHAEFNFWFDPHAAHAVLASNIPMVMFGLDVTNNAVITPERIRRIRESGTAGEFSARMLAYYGDAETVHLHDPCVTAYLAKPELFSGIEAFCEVEVQSPLTLGRSVAAVSKRDLAGRNPNCLVITGCDSDGLFGLLEARLATLS
ncbi:MAG: cysteine hydrolase [Thermomicrobiales bacterium]|nr:cysteine hydrolase [Thermomicrobiales bacterium]